MGVRPDFLEKIEPTTKKFVNSMQQKMKDGDSRPGQRRSGWDRSAKKAMPEPALLFSAREFYRTISD